MANDLATSLQELLVDFLKPLDEAARDPQALIDWLATLGHTAAVAGHPTLLQIAQHAQAVIGKLEALDAQTLMSTSGLISLLATGREAAAILQELRTFAADPARSQFAQGLAEDVMSFLLASYLRRKHPTAFRIASLLTLIDARETAAMDAPIVDNGTTLRYARVLDRFKFATLGDLVSQPGATLGSIYFPNGFAQGADTWLGAQRLFPVLSYLARAIDLSWRTEYRRNLPAPTPPDPDPDEPIHDIEEVLDDPEDPSIAAAADQDQGEAPLPPLPPVPDDYYAANDPALRLNIAGDAANGLALQILALSQKHPGGVAGFVAELAGDFNHSGARGQWKLTASASGEIPAFAVGANGIARVPTSSPVTSGSAKLVIERLPDEGTSGPAFLLGAAAGTRLELGNLQLTLGVSYDAQQIEALIDLAATSGMLVLAAGDGDGFLSSILPSDGLQAKFDLGLSWSSAKGLTLRGGAGLDATLPVGLSFAGVSLSSMHLRLQASNDHVNAEASASLSASIGPVLAVLDRIGITGALSFPQGGGNLGLADLDLGFKPPSGVGLSIDAHGVLTGGGFLFHDEAQGLYAGAMQLSLHEQITLKAFGLIATRMPDGSRGYSLIVFITAEDFRPVPLGLGFTLLGIGGMVGVNRTFDQEVLRQGLKNGTLATLLFPRDPVGNAPTLIRNLASAFPARRGSYLLGLLAKIGWFTPTLVLLDLALILEFGNRTRLLALGRISALLPSADNDLVRLNLEAMGVIDFDVGTAALDAVLIDSRLAHKFAITGSAALRAGFGAGPSFVLSVGGLNPHFAPPANLPALERVAIALSSGNNPRLICEAYFAITSNTVQFGARASLYASAAGFSVEGDVGYDVLVQIAPLHFIADFHARLQLKHGSHNLFMVALQGELEGPRPLRVSGKATFEILWCHFSVRFDTTLVQGEAPPLPPAVDVLTQLTQALAAPTSWSTQSSAAPTHGVALRSLSPAAPGAPLVLDPLGQLVVKQQVVPLNTGRDIDTFGGAPVAGARRFALSAALNGTALASAALQSSFAPAQFFVMSDDEKLAAPAFETMDAGCLFGTAQTLIDATQIIAAPLTYQTIVIGTPAPAASAAPTARAASVSPAPAPASYTLSAAQLRSFSRSGAAARAPLRRVGRARFRNDAVAAGASFKPKRWTIMPNGDGSAASVDSSVRTWSEYHAVLKSLNRASARWQLMPAHELQP